MKKKALAVLLSLVIVCSSNVVAFAGTWEKKVYNDNTFAWEYKDDNGQYFGRGWKYIDGSWYYFRSKCMMSNCIAYTMNGDTFHKYGAPAYYLGPDGKMVTHGGFMNDSYGYSTFLDSNGHVVTGFFMVDDVLYYVYFDNTGGYTIHSMDTTYYGEARIKFQCTDGKERTLHCIKDGGKVLELDGNPIKSDDKFYQLVKYIPKYNSQGVLVGEIRN